MSFETQHYFIVEKEEKNIVFAKCIRHKTLEFGVGIRKNDLVEMIYIGTDKEYAEKLYSSLISNS